MMSLASGFFLHNACETPGGEAQQAMGNKDLEPEKEGVVEDRDLGIIDTWLVLTS